MEKMNNYCIDRKLHFKNIKSTISSEYLLIDIETTGLDPEKDDIIEVYFKHVKEGKIVLEGHRKYFSPLWWKTKHLTKIELEKIKDFSNFNDKVNKKFNSDLMDLLLRCVDENDNLVLVAHYSKFERDFFKYKLGVEMDKCDIYDSWEVERFLYPRETHNLRDMCLRRNIATEDDLEYLSHQAMSDVLLLEEVVRYQLGELIKNYQDQF